MASKLEQIIHKIFKLCHISDPLQDSIIKSLLNAKNTKVFLSLILILANAKLQLLTVDLTD